ncbi:S-methyl-5'-thioadenosine phosphorylase [Myxococcota bacterium]|nr:S-methyl-5'-thioadenosine phosphorylase [Myxococcota bacterium]
MTNPQTIGVIGGSGLYEMEGLEQIERVKVSTPFGDPSDAYITGVLHGQKMVFLPRHGVGHKILPHEINFRANLWGMKKLGVSQLISVSAVGSMKEHIAPGHIVFVDQFIDLTKRRISTFYGGGAVVHVPMADPVCSEMRGRLVDVARELGVKSHDGGTYVCIEGPQFSTRAESFVYRSWGVDVIGMTNMPEAKLAREAEICYASIALATDYDCWHVSEESVTVEAVLKTLSTNVATAKSLIRAYAANPPDVSGSICQTAARTSLMTATANIPTQLRRDLEPIFAPFLPIE